MKETKIRSLTKTISWRIIATLTTTTLVYMFTRNFKLSLQIGILEVILKLIFYYEHERIWNKIKWETNNTK